MVADGWECWGEGWDVSSVGKPRYREEVWELPRHISTVPAPRAFLFVPELGRQDVTGAWHCSPCPLPALPALMDAGQHPPESRAVASRRKGWGETKRMGEVGIFSSDEKLWLVPQAQEGLFKISQPASYFFSGLEGKILQRLPCFRTRLQGTALLALAFMEKSTVSHRSLSLSWCFFL